MSTIGSSALATVQARRFSTRTQMNMRKRGGIPSNLAGSAAAAAVASLGSGSGLSVATASGSGRANFYKQMYGPGAKNGVKAGRTTIQRRKVFDLRRSSTSTINSSMPARMAITTPCIAF